MRAPETPPGDHRISSVIYDPLAKLLTLYFWCKRQPVSLDMSAQEVPTDEMLKELPNTWVELSGIDPNIQIQLLDVK